MWGTTCFLTSTHLCRARLGVKTRVFHLGDYRRENVGPGQSIPEDYFFVNGALDRLDCLSFAYLKLMPEMLASASSVLLRQKILKKCRDDIYHFLNHENGQIAIYDAVNPLAAGRRSLAKEFAKHDVEVSSDRINQFLVRSMLTGS